MLPCEKAGAAALVRNAVQIESTIFLTLLSWMVWTKVRVPAAHAAFVGSRGCALHRGGAIQSIDPDGAFHDVLKSAMSPL
jgi:hypothetical protein